MPGPENSHSAFARRLRKCVDKAGSSRRLGELIGVHRNTINAYLRATEPDRSTLIKIAEASGVTPEWLTFGIDPGDSHGDSVPVAPGELSEEFFARFAQLVKEEGGIVQFAEITGLPSDRIEKLIAGAEMSVSELARICRKSRTPVSWILKGKGFDQQERSYVAQAVDELISNLELVEEKRPETEFKSFKAQKQSAWFDGSLPAVFDLFEKILERLEPGKYKIHVVRDNLMSDTMEPDDLAVVMLEVEPTMPGIYLFQKGTITFFARGVSASDLTTFSFDNSQYDKAAANRLLSPDAHTLCLGRVVKIFGSPH